MHFMNHLLVQNLPSSEVLISGLRELRKLRMDPSKARNLRSTISIIHFAKRLEDTLYKETEKTDSTTPSQEDKT